MLGEPRLNSEEIQATGPEDDELVMSLVEGALERPPEEWEAYLRAACSENPRLFDVAWSYVEWEKRMRGFLLDPLFSFPRSEQLLRPGDVLDERFRVVREVAQGGMGVVYEAWDARLERRIAIKCAKIGFRKRLPPEVRHASEISHPNICKIFEIHTASVRGDEFDFLTMEFLEGETLLERMRRGPVPDAEAKIIGRQLCEGLAEAHRNHVVHGDLKSTNVILATAADGGLRAVITDFGLARNPEAAPFQEQSRPVAGTLDYMAPELLQGSKLSLASDLYALGVMLYSLAAGRQPFPVEASWEDRLVRRPPPVKHRWNPAIQRCLDPDPRRRFRDAGEVGRAIAPARSRLRLSALAAAVLMVISYLVATQRAPAPREPVRLAVLPFQSAPDAVPLAGKLVQAVAADVSRLKGNARTELTVIPLIETHRRGVDTPEKARRLLRATHVLQATVAEDSHKVRIHAWLTDTHSLVPARDWTVEYAPGELRYVPAALAGMVTGTLRLPPVAAGAVNAAARQDYAAGLLEVRRDTGVDDALARLERAVAADADSPLTHAALAEARWFKYYLTRDSVWLGRAAASVREAERRNPDLAAVYRIAGLLESNSGHYDVAVAGYRRAIELEPNNSDGYRRLGLAQESKNQFSDALAAYRRAAEVEPGYYRNHQALGALYMKLADYGEAARHFEKTVALAPEEPGAHFALASAYCRFGRFGDAESQLRRSIALKETPTALHTLGVVLMYEAKDREAITWITRALSRWPERYLWWMDLGIACRRINLPARARRADRRGLALAEKELARDPRVGTIRADLAYLCAQLGDRRRAESEVVQALQLSPADADTRWAAAVTYEALGRRDDTLAVLRDSPPEVLSGLSRWPEVADLREDSRFLQLLASRQIK